MSLDDNDGVAGVAAVRKSTSILRELIPEYQSVGEYSYSGPTKMYSCCSAISFDYLDISHTNQPK